MQQLALQWPKSLKRLARYRRRGWAKAFFTIDRLIERHARRTLVKRLESLVLVNATAEANVIAVPS
jgi:hypothetical protein